MASDRETPRQASHLRTRIQSAAVPSLGLRVLEARDAPALARLVPGVADPDAAVARMRQSAATPTVLAPEGVVASGPDRVNLAVVLLAGPSTTSSGAGATSRAGTRLDDEDKGPDSPGGDEVIGLGGFGAIKTLHHPSRPGRSLRAGDAGVLIGESHRARGYAAEAMRLAIDWAFTPVAQGGPQLDLVTVTTLRDNAPMIALAERHLGLAGKGVLRPAEGGEPVGEMYYELWPEEWHAMKTAGQLGIRS